MASTECRRGPQQGANARKQEEGDGSTVQQQESATVYEALLTHSDSLARVQAMRSRIEQLGGALRIEQVGGAILVTLTLPAPFTPEQIYPSLPFFAV